jgi:hypothetical protein
MIPISDYDSGGLIKTGPAIKILTDNNLTADPYKKSYKYHLTEYMGPNDILWVTGIVNGIPHHTYS